ncbi:MAG: histidine phosphatase family protein [Candidatus Aminicenantes bacterium]|nr:histidine phosphatase family protein [Candidatus Aminicenantes bacterium]
MTVEKKANHQRVLYLIRHGETRSNREGIFRGRLEIPLSNRGKEQARALRQATCLSTTLAVVSSPLQRAQATARLAFPNMPISVDQRLNNLDLGVWSGKRKKDIQHDFPGEWERWVHDPHSIRFAGGESLKDVHQRVQRFLEWFQTSANNPLAAVTHRSVIKCLLGVAMGLDSGYFWKFHLDNGSISQLVWEPGRGFTLSALNRTSHLPHLVTEWY